MSGSNFATNSSVGVYFDSTSGAPVVTGTSDGTGVLPSVSFTVPNIPVGSHKLILMDTKSRYPVQKSFIVN